MTPLDKLKIDMDGLLKSLRKCDTQATAVTWMASAYDAMDSALRAIAVLERRVREEASEAKGLIFYPPKPKIEIVQSIPPQLIAHRAEPNYIRPNGQTVVYPDFFLHPGLKPAPKAWTKLDTYRLEAAQKARRSAIVRKGR